jgi:uncharacterized membrane protein YgcG
MRKNILLIIILALAAVLSACSAAASAGGAAQTSSGPLNTDYDNALPVESQLLFGTMLLDGTQNEVDAQTASELIPLWQAVGSLSGSDSASPEEIQALFDQIQETMGPERIQAIADMQITRQNMGQKLQELGLDVFPGRGQSGDLPPEVQATAQAARESGQPNGGGEGFPGGPPDGGGFGPGGGTFGGGENLNPEQLATMQAQRGSQAGTGFGVSTTFVDAVVQYLQEKAG